MRGYPQLYGRDPELERIESLASSVARAAVDNVAAVGESGMGKSAIGQVCLAAADAKGLPAVSLEINWLIDASVAGHLLGQLVARIQRLQPTGRRVPGLYAGYASHLKPNAASPSLLGVDVAAAAFAQLVSNHLAHQPLVMVVDNVDAADAGTQRALAAALARARSDESNGFGLLITSAPPLPRLFNAHKLVLDKLGFSAAAHIVKAARPAATSEEVRAILARSEGSPFWITELAQSLVREEHPVEALENIDLDQYGPAILQRVPPSAHDAVCIAAVLNDVEPASPEVVAQLANIETDVAVRALRSARGVVRVDPPGSTGYGIVHRLTQLALRTTMPLDERVRCHVAASAAAASAGRDVAAARHILCDERAAVRVLGRAHAVHLLLTAQDTATPDERRDLLTEAVQLTVGPEQDAMRRKLAHVLLVAHDGDWEAALPELERRRPDPARDEELAEWTELMCRCLGMKSWPDQTELIALLAASVGDLRDAPTSRLRVRALQAARIDLPLEERADVWRELTAPPVPEDGHKPTDALRLVAVAKEASRSGPVGPPTDPLSVVGAITSALSGEGFWACEPVYSDVAAIAWLLVSCEEFDLAEAFEHKAREYLAPRTRQGSGLLLAVKATRLLLRGDLLDAAATAREATDQGPVQRRGIAALARAEVLLLEGRLAEALQALPEGATSGSPTASDWQLGITTARVLREHHRLRESVEALVRVACSRIASGLNSPVFPWASELVVTLERAGATGTARLELEQLICGHALLVRTVACDPFGRSVDVAMQLADHESAAAQRWGSSGCLARAARARALAIGDASPTDAERCLREALSLNGLDNVPLERASLMIALAGQRSIGRDEATDLLQGARDVAATRHAWLLVSRAEETWGARFRGSNAVGKGRSGEIPIGPRVAWCKELAAAGATNSDIRRLLTEAGSPITEKTIKNYLSKMREVLTTRNRALPAAQPTVGDTRPEEHRRDLVAYREWLFENVRARYDVGQ